MDSKTDTPTKTPLSPFERFVQAILRVPKAAVDEAEAKREKRPYRGSAKDDVRDH
jgi:hypothetical protein